MRDRQRDLYNGSTVVTAQLRRKRTQFPSSSRVRGTWRVRQHDRGDSERTADHICTLRSASRSFDDIIGEQVKAERLSDC